MHNFHRKLMASAKIIYANGVHYRTMQDKSCRFWKGGGAESISLPLVQRSLKKLCMNAVVTTMELMEFFF